MIRNYKRTVLYLLATVALVSNCYGEENIKQAGEPDYSETQWRTFYGEKPADYRPEYWVTYYGSRDNEECYKPNVVSVVDGKSRIRKEIYKEFIAEEKDDGKGYIIRYPNRFKIGNCMYSSGGGQLYIEEKSNDPRLNQEPYINKTQVRRSTLIRNGDVAIISLIGDISLEIKKKSKNYLNKLDYNIFCYKKNWDDDFGDIKNIKSLICFSSSIENGINKILAYNSYISYTLGFWKNNPDIKVDLKVSNKTYCDKDNYCYKNNLPKIDKDFLTPEKFLELYQKGDR
ncbi:hypothetical protein BKG95_07370 [Rodentibacter pneumotropicus]|uniref:Lipoprotein n=1 Tax=Rodentibacter pneumotropicus TaxID=758 RepID=A0AAW5LGF6_9PAST|nr:hypothetical protein [Rodentibacter pneumotropicus]MCQ9122395.1 hypothetical protein [Rodentibacter pneumotropicus]OOF67537.1 hypothetical protein BKG95_07370 [Rodentibacter pneumotropicus]